MRILCVEEIVDHDVSHRFGGGEIL